MSRNVLWMNDGMYAFNRMNEHRLERAVWTNDGAYVVNCMNKCNERGNNSTSIPHILQAYDTRYICSVRKFPYLILSPLLFASPFRTYRVSNRDKTSAHTYYMIGDVGRDMSIKSNLVEAHAPLKLNHDSSVHLCQTQVHPFVAANPCTRD